MATAEVWFLIIDIKNTPIGSPSEVVAKNISDLQDKVKAKNSNILQNVDAVQLVVWRCKEIDWSNVARGQFEQTISRIDFSDETKAVILDSREKVKDLRLDDDEILLVQVPDDRGNKRKHDEVERYSSPPELKRLKKEVGEAAPSSLAPAAEFRHITGPEHTILCNRPFFCDTIPVELLHEAFGIFKTRCGAPPSKNALNFLAALGPVACHWYNTELERRTEVQRTFEEYTGLQFHAEHVPGTDYTTNGNLDVIVMPAVIRVCKNEDGHALTQAIVYYAKFLLSAFDHSRSYQNHNTRFPCILMIDRGSTLGFYGAVWDGHVRVDPLMPTFDLSTHHMDTCNRHAIASGLDAFIEAVAKIEAHNVEIEAAAKANTHDNKHDNKHRLAEAHKYPYMTSYEINGREITLTYKERLHPTKLLFSGIDDQLDSSQYIVKFTRRYSEEVHRYLASLGSAPKLWQCKEIPGGWFAVLMDLSRYEVLWNLSLSKEQQEKVHLKVTKMVKMLHDRGFVHGDIRDTNLLVDRNSLSSDEVKVHFIDFDWAGRIGEAKYPIDVNCESVKRPEGVKGGELISEGDDKDMVSYLFGLLGRVRLAYLRSSRRDTPPLQLTAPVETVLGK